MAGAPSPRPRRGSGVQCRSLYAVPAIRIGPDVRTLVSTVAAVTAIAAGNDHLGGFSGIAVETPAHIKASTTRRGFEDTTPEDTFDGDYGRLLDQMAQTAREGWRPRRDWIPSA